jgi:hypothetical protein
MRNHRHKLLSTAAILAVSAMTLAMPARAGGESIDDEMMGLNSEFEIGNGDHFTVYRGLHAKSYRICVKDSPGGVPVEVRDDSRSLAIADGSCEDVRGYDIVIAPAARLKGDEILVGRYEPKSR